MTVSKLFAGNKHNNGDYNCYFCGINCDDSYFSEDYIKETFTNRDVVKYPGSNYICVGCVMSLGWGEDEMLMLDNSIKQRINDKGMAPRMYSWVIAKEKKWAFTKAHTNLIRDIILFNQPKPPFSIILADSGQKHLIFRATIAITKNEFPVMLEEEIIGVKPRLLEERLKMALPIVAAIGKPVLTEELKINNFISYEKYHGNITGLEEWQKVQHEPLSRLAAWLSISKEDAKNECPAIESGRIPEKTSGVNRSCQTDSRNGSDYNQRRSDQTMLDFS